MPWAKKAFSLSELKFSNGRTAIDLSDVEDTEVGLAFVPLERVNWKRSNPAARTATTTMIAISLRPVLRVIDSLGATSSARLIPSGVISKAQARIRATGKPRTRTTTKTFITQAGASKVGN